MADVMFKIGFGGMIVCLSAMIAVFLVYIVGPPSR